MATRRHPIPPEIAELTLEDIAQRFIGRFRDKVPDWAAFEDAKIDGYRRAQHRFIGAGGSGKHDDPDVIPARAFTLSVMFVPPGEGNAPHTHEVEEVFFVLQGYLTRSLSRTRPAIASRDASAPGNASLARPESSTAIRTKAPSNPSISRSCSAAARPTIRWAMRDDELLPPAAAAPSTAR